MATYTPLERINCDICNKNGLCSFWPKLGEVVNKTLEKENYYPICKHCVVEEIESPLDLEGAKKACALLDIPFIEKMWVTSAAKGIQKEEQSKIPNYSTLPRTTTYKQRMLIYIVSTYLKNARGVNKNLFFNKTFIPKGIEKTEEGKKLIEIKKAVLEKAIYAGKSKPKEPVTWETLRVDDKKVTIASIMTGAKKPNALEVKNKKIEKKMIEEPEKFNKTIHQTRIDNWNEKEVEVRDYRQETHLTPEEKKVFNREENEIREDIEARQNQGNLKQTVAVGYQWKDTPKPAPYVQQPEKPFIPPKPPTPTEKIIRGINSIVNEYGEIDVELLSTFDKRYLVKKWGEKYDWDTLLKLEELWVKMQSAYEITNPSLEDYLLKICKISCEVEVAMNSDNWDLVKILGALYDKWMQSAMFTESSKKSRKVKEDKEAELIPSICEVIAICEKKGFFDTIDLSVPRDIVDLTLSNLNSYTRKLVLSETNMGALLEGAIQKMLDSEERNSRESNVVDEYEEGNDIPDFTEGSTSPEINVQNLEEYTKRYDKIIDIQLGNSGVAYAPMLEESEDEDEDEGDEFYVP